ncbi:MAG: hypothetical protein JWM21_1659 [Acidobacteria bacterium]|nr:hypothetical protein [Acidobacteriota bacterium]
MVFKIDLVRPDDLLNLRVEAINLRLESGKKKKPELVVDKPETAAFLIITFPPQTIAEHAYFEAAIVPQDHSDPPKVIEPGSKTERKDPEIETAKTMKDPDLPGEVGARIGKPTRLVFKVKAEARIPFSIAGLLEWSGLELSVNPIAAISRTPTPDQIAKAPLIKPPTATETAIELPYRLIISPTSEVRWLHRPGLFTSRGRTELWHTRLANKVAVTDEHPEGIAELTKKETASLRAIWSPDYAPYPEPAALDPDLGRTAMSPNDRHQIVILTSAFSGFEVAREFGAVHPFAVDPLIQIDLGVHFNFSLNVPYVPEPFEAEQIMLSPLGGWLKSRGHWSPPHAAPPRREGLHASVDLLEPVRRALAPAPLRSREFAELFVPILKPEPEPSLDLSEWVHIATQGRDHYVRIVYEGELWGFRNKAALIKITERKFRKNKGIIGAYLVQRMFIVVREPEKIYPDNDFGNPFKRVRLTTLVTPDIAEPDIVVGHRSFWVKVMADPTTPVPFKFHGVGYDIDGHAADFSVPLMFVSKSDYEAPAPAVAYFNKSENIPDRNVEIPGQKVMFAKPAPGNSNTQLVTQTLNFFMDPARVQPKMLRASVKIPQVQELLGTNEATTIRFFPPYVANGFDPLNKTGVFAQIVDASYSDLNPVDPNAGLKKMQNDFRADKAGGFATPNLGLSTLSRQLGPLAGKAEDAVANKFDPKEFFPKSGGAKLFGTFDLMDLMDLPTPIALNTNAPQMHTTLENGGTVIVTRLDWEPEFKGKDLGVAKIEKDDGSTFTVHAEIRKSVNPGGITDPPSSTFTGTLTNFTVTIVNDIAIHFSRFSFTTKNSQKPDVTVALQPDPLTFTGDLQFVEELRNAIPPGLFGQGPSLDLLQNPLGIKAGFSFSLPPIAVGVFALKDVSVGAALTLPFLDGKPVFDFNFCERQHPFLLTVSLFGGGGFFHLQLDTAGIKLLEAAIEFGAAAAIDIGVASGEVHIMAGIYFSLQRKETSTELAAILSGYLRMGGSLSVLGIIKVTVEFNLSFTYDSGRDKAFGRATLTVEVEVLFFSASVELTVERAFGGSGDPKFGQLFSEPQMWNDYALAFA